MDLEIVLAVFIEMGAGKLEERGNYAKIDGLNLVWMALDKM